MISCECLECGKVYPLTAGFNCDHTEEPLPVGWSFTQRAADEYVYRLEYERRQENALKEIEFLEDLYRAA